VVQILCVARALITIRHATHTSHFE